MALSQADFYAYSRATGVPVPQSQEEQAELAPQVLNFRRNQLRAPSQEPSGGVDPVSVGIGVGLALAGGVGAGLGIRRLMQGPKKSATAGVRQADLAKLAAESGAVQQVAAAEVPVSRVATAEVAPSRPAPTASTPVATATPDQPSIDVWEGKSFSPRSYLEDAGSLAPQDLTSIQQQSLPQVIEQKIEAVDSSANQQQLRIASELQRNEDVDVSAAQQFLNQRRTELQSQGLRPSQVENILASDPNIKEGAELFAATGDVGALSRIGPQPASPIELRATQQAATPGTPAETVRTKEFYKPLPFGENVEYLVEQDIDLTNKISSLSAQQQQLPNIRARLEEQANMAEFAMKQGGPTADEALRVYSNTQYQLSNLPDFSADISEAVNQRDYVRQQMQSLEALGPKRKLQPIGEGFSIAEETGELIPRRASVPAGVVEKPAAGSSIRGMAGLVEMESFIPEERMQAGTASKEFAMGPRVGIEPERREAMLRRPVEWTPELYPAKRRSPEGYVYTEEAMRKPSVPVGRETVLRRALTRRTDPEVARRSVDVSETIRRLQSSNRPDAQDQLRQFLQGLS